MKGREIALATLHRESVSEPCINYCWMTNSAYMSRLAGRDYWQDPEGVFFEYLRRSNVNLCPQDYLPSAQHRRLEAGEIMREVEEKRVRLDDVIAAIEALPSDRQVERDLNIEDAAEEYAGDLEPRMERADHEVLFISGFGQPDFMGGYTRWGYENYLTAIALYPDLLRRYYHHTALRARLKNHAIVLARRKHGIAPFVYGGQDICTSRGPIISPAMLRELYFPELKWALEPLVEGEIGIIWHCDGDIRLIIDDLLGLGVDGLQGFEEEHGPDYAQIVKLNNKRGRCISVWGCVSVVSTFPHGAVEDVKAAVERSFTLAGKGRGFVLSSTSSIMPEVPHENIDAFFEHGKRFGEEFLA